MTGNTGYMAIIRNLDKPVEQWVPGGCPLTLMMNIELSKGKPVPVIKKYIVELEKNPFKLFTEVGPLVESLH